MAPRISMCHGQCCSQWQFGSTGMGTEPSCKPRTVHSRVGALCQPGRLPTHLSYQPPHDGLRRQVSAQQEVHSDSDLASWVPVKFALQANRISDDSILPSNAVDFQSHARIRKSEIERPFHSSKSFHSIFAWIWTCAHSHLDIDNHMFRCPQRVCGDHLEKCEKLPQLFRLLWTVSSAV